MMTFNDYKSANTYKGKSIYNALFELHSGNIKTKKQVVAVKNLEKIFRATFKISAKIGFHEMSLRDLCRETGLSMGGIYSCIGSKDIIAIMVKDMVKQVTGEIIEKALQHEDKNIAIHEIITHLIYSTAILQPWFYFLYFETRSLPAREQEDSKQIESLIVNTLEALMIQTHRPGNKAQNRYHFIGTMLLAMIQERYLKPWKYKQSDQAIEDYVTETLNLARSALE